MLHHSNKSSVNSLEPRSSLIYFVILTWSILIFLAGSAGILFILYLTYRKWTVLMHNYCSDIVQLKSVDLEDKSLVDLTGRNEKKLLLDSDDDDNSELAEDGKDKSRKAITARITKVKMPSDDTENKEPVKMIEIEPNKFSEKLSKLDSQMRNPGPDKELGRLSFRLEYNSENNELHIGPIRGEGLRKKNSQAILNPFIVLYIWPDNIWPVKTSVIKRTNSPRWEETIVYEQFDLKYMSEKALHFKIQTWRQLKPNEIIGHVVLPLKVIKEVTKGLFSEYFLKNLQPDLQINRGAIKIILNYNKPEIKDDHDDQEKEEDKEEIIKEEIVVTILKANLIYTSGFIPDQCQVFVKVSIIHPNLPVQSKFTSIQRGSFQPVWNENLIFKVLPENISNLSIIISIREEGFSKEGKLFAYVELGPEHSELNNAHLRTILKKPNKMVTQWHQLISNIL